MATTAPAAVKFLSRQELQERCVSRLWAGRDLQLLDLGARLHGAPEQPDGLLYPSRMFPRCSNAAMLDRSSSAWQEELLGNLLSYPDASGDPAVFQILEDQGWGLVE